MHQLQKMLDRLVAMIETYPFFVRVFDQIIGLAYMSLLVTPHIIILKPGKL